MRRPVVLLALAAVALSAVPGHAAPTKKPQIVDAATDALGGQAGTEITSVLWTTSGETTTTRYRGKKVTTYTPRRLVVTMNLAGAPMTTAPFSYETSADVAGCGTIRFVYTPGTVYSQIVSDTFLWYDCGPGDSVSGPGLTLVPGVSTKLGPKSITWEYPIKGFGKSVKVGAPVASFTAAVHVVEPVLGLDGTTDTDTPIDGASSDAVWRLGS